MKKYRKRILSNNKKMLSLLVKKLKVMEQLMTMLLSKEKMMTIMRIKMRLRLKELRSPLERN
jgi:hypothetical protein